MIEPAHLARRALDDDVAESDLPVPADGDLIALGGLAAHAHDGGAVKLFHRSHLGMGPANATLAVGQTAGGKHGRAGAAEPL
ncbi:hypothetical protein D9M69_701490 [compost metagenome]